MNLYSISKMPFSTKAAWSELGLIDHVVGKVFLFLVVPFSALPPAMILYTGMNYGNGFSTAYWSGVATVFFLAEITTVSVMGWLIERAARWCQETISYRNAYLLAAIAPIPLWLSSLGLFMPSMVFNAYVSLIALSLSCGLIYHGVRSFCRLKDSTHAGTITRLVFGAGLLAWAALLCLLLYFSGVMMIPSVAIIGL